MSVAQKQKKLANLRRCIRAVCKKVPFGKKKCPKKFFFKCVLNVLKKKLVKKMGDLSTKKSQTGEGINFKRLVKYSPLLYQVCGAGFNFNFEDFANINLLLSGVWSRLHHQPWGGAVP